MRKIILISDTGGNERKNPSNLNGSLTCDLLVSDSDALPLSYRRLVRARSLSKLGSCRSS